MNGPNPSAASTARSPFPSHDFFFHDDNHANPKPQPQKTMKNPSKHALKRAKATLAGRILCRLLGEETGAVLMEYVVLGVLLVAAVVGAVVYFGKGITGSFHIMTDAMTDPGQAQTTRTTEIANNATEYATATAHQAAMTGGGAAAGGGTGTGTGE